MTSPTVDLVGLVAPAGPDLAPPAPSAPSAGVLDELSSLAAGLAFPLTASALFLVAGVVTGYLVLALVVLGSAVAVTAALIARISRGGVHDGSS